MAAPMAGTGRLAARRKARLLPTGRVAHGLAQRSRAVHPLPPPRLETEQRSSPPPLPPPCAVRPTRRHSAPRHCSTWGPTAASAAAAAAGPTAAAPFQIRLGRDPRRRVAGVQPAIAIPGDRDPRLRHLLAGTHTYGAGTHSCHSTGVKLLVTRTSLLLYMGSVNVQAGVIFQSEMKRRIPFSLCQAKLSQTSREIWRQD
jgi:hypothetical protein